MSIGEVLTAVGQHSSLLAIVEHELNAKHREIETLVTGHCQQKTLTTVSLLQADMLTPLCIAMAYAIFHDGSLFGVRVFSMDHGWRLSQGSPVDFSRWTHQGPPGPEGHFRSAAATGWNRLAVCRTVAIHRKIASHTPPGTAPKRHLRL